MSDARAVVYLVRGSAGMFEDNSKWVVAVFTCKNKALAWRELCQKKATDAYAEVEKRREEYYAITDDKVYLRTKYPEPQKFEEDPNADIERDTSYWVEEVPLNPILGNSGK